MDDPRLNSAATAMAHQLSEGKPAPSRIYNIGSAGTPSRCANYLRRAAMVQFPGGYIAEIHSFFR